MSADNGSTLDPPSKIQSTLSDLGNKAAQTVDNQRVAAAGGIASAAAGLHGQADKLAAGGQRAASLTHSAADKLNSTAEYIRGKDLSAMFEDAKDMVKRNPVPAIIGATALGFLLARAFSRRD